MRFEILGPIRVRAGDREITVTAGRERALLATLLLHANSPVTTDTLINSIWDTEAPQTARNQLQRCVHQLRQRLTAGIDQPVIVTEATAYRISVDPTDLDLLEFRRLTAQARNAARAGKTDEAADQYRTALGLWRGPALADVDSLRVRRDATALDEEHVQVLEERFDVELAAGGEGELVAELTNLVQQHPYREKLHRTLMLALYRAGRVGDALAAYRRARELLHDNLGIEPGTELHDLHQAILNRDPDLRAATAAVRSPPAPRELPVPRELPADVAGFTGRLEVLVELDKLLPDGQHEPAPVVISAIAGTAGVGKTALAVHWAHRVADRFPDGQLFVNLRGYDRDQPMSPAEALARLLASMGVASQDIPVDVDDRAARYRSAVAGRRMLIVLDNAARVDQVRPLLPGSGTCAVVVTSRDSLAGLVAVHGAHRLVLDVLPEADAVMLLRRLIGSRAGAEPDAVAVLAQQCARLPLGLRVAAELAAARPTSSLADLAAELSNQQRRLELLDAGDDPHAAVRVVFSWSVRHLPSDAAVTFGRLGLHPGLDFDQYAVAALAGSSLTHAQDSLDLLVRAHLVQSAGSGRYGMHDLLRAYAAHLAAAEGDDGDDGGDDGDGDQQRRNALGRLFDYYLAASAAAMDAWHPAEVHRRPRVPRPATPVPDLSDPDTARTWLDTNRSCLVAAAAHAATRGWPSHTIRLSTTLFRYLQGGGHYSDALAIHGSARHAAEQIGDLGEQAHALRHLGATHHQVGLYGVAADHLRRALAMFREVGDQNGEAAALNNLAVAEERLGNYRTATEHYRHALGVFRRVGELSGVANTLTGLGVIEEWHGNYGQAADYYRQAMGMFEQIGNRPGEALARHNLGNVEERLGHYQAAADQHSRALAVFRALGHPQGEAHALDGLGGVQVRLGHPVRATEHFRRALAIFREIGDRDGEAQALDKLGEAERTLGNLPAALTRYTEALTIATTGELPDLEARIHTGLGHTHRALGDITRARTHYERAHQRYEELGRPEAEDVRAYLTTITEPDT